MDRIGIANVKILDFRISDQSFFWLFTFLIKDTKVVPNLWLQGVKRSGLDDVLKSVVRMTIDMYLFKGTGKYIDAGLKA